MRGGLSTPVFERLSTVLSDRIGLYFPIERRRDLERGLVNACPDLGFQHLQDCADWLIASPLSRSQIEVLAAHLTIGETYFFRERSVLDAVRDHILPAVMHRNARDARRQVRIWSAGCCTGEEAYSIAMLIAMNPGIVRGCDVSILATDINPAFLRIAGEGVYGEWSFRNVESGIREKFFTRKGANRFEILPSIRDAVVFSHLNLVEDGFPSLLNGTNGMDIIFCRNVLMYFNEETRFRVVANFRKALVENGWMIVSLSEISHVSYARFDTVSYPDAIVYQKSSVETAAPYSAPGAMHRFPSHLSAPPEPPMPFRFVPELAPADRPVATPPTAPRVSPAQDASSRTRDRREAIEAATASFNRGDFADAAAGLERMLDGGKAGPAADTAEALLLLAKCHANQGLLDSARQWCERALAADKMAPAAHYLLATVLVEEGHPEEAMASLRRALYLDQNFVLALYTLAGILKRLGRAREAEKAVTNALALLDALPADAVLPESDGLAVSRLREVILTTYRREA